MASIVWRADRGKWYAYYHINGKHTGTPIPEAPARKTLSKHERALLQAEAERIAEGKRDVAITEIDIETASAFWLDDVKATCSLRTYERYRTTAKLFLDYLVPVGKRIPATNVTMSSIRGFRDNRLNGHAASTVINDLKCLHAMFEWIRKQRTGGIRWIPENPCEDVDYPKRAVRNVVFPTDTEVGKMLAALVDKPVEFKALGTLGAFAGMRRNEIILLRWDWVDLDRGLIYAHGKSKQPRPIPIHPKVRVLLDNIPRLGDLVLPSPYAATGQQRSPFVAREFNDWLRDLGFRWTHHGLRRWFNDRLRQSTGLTASARRLVVGHEDEATNRLYQNPQAEEARPFVEALAP
jgi:integrase